MQHTSTVFIDHALKKQIVTEAISQASILKKPLSILYFFYYIKMCALL